VSPLAIQGPKADDLLTAAVGEHIRELPFFAFTTANIADTEVLVARSGYSGQGGYELYLQDSDKGEALWDVLMTAGQPFNVRAGCPNLLERIESGLLSYGNDMTIDNNPFEVGLDRFFKLDKAAEYLGREALQKIQSEGVSQQLVKLRVDTTRSVALRSTFSVLDAHNEPCGYVTSMAHSQKHQASLALAYLQKPWLDSENNFSVRTDESESFAASRCDENWQPMG